MRARQRVLWGLVAVLALAGLALPAVASGYWLRTVTFVLMTAAMAQGWNIMGGFTGYPDFGVVTFFGVGGYTTGILMNKLHFPFFGAVLSGGVVCVLFAAIVGLPILRLRGHYFAIATLGIAEATREIVAAWEPLTGGGSGITLPISHSPYFFQMIYYSMLGLVAATLVATFLLRRSKLGYGLMAIRADEEAAKTLGIDTTLFKVMAYALDAAIVGLAGGIYAYWNTALVPEATFDIAYTLQAITSAILGGPGTVWGPLVGATIFEVVRTYFWSTFPGMHATFLGMVVVFVIIFMPRGAMEFLSGRRRFSIAAMLEHVAENRV